MILQQLDDKNHTNIDLTALSFEDVLVSAAEVSSRTLLEALRRKMVTKNAIKAVIAHSKVTLVYQQQQPAIERRTLTLSDDQVVLSDHMLSIALSADLAVTITVDMLSGQFRLSPCHYVTHHSRLAFEKDLNAHPDQIITLLHRLKFQVCD